MQENTPSNPPKRTPDQEKLNQSLAAAIIRHLPIDTSVLAGLAPESSLAQIPGEQWAFDAQDTLAERAIQKPESEEQPPQG